MEDIVISVPEDVFSRDEPEGRQFLLRPLPGKPPRVALLSAPAAGIWRALRARSPDRTTVVGCPSPTVRSVLALLRQQGFIVTDEGLQLDREAPGSAAALGFLDPWDYQFGLPVLHSPWFALWEITDDCPLQTSCHFCYRPKDISGGPSPDQAEHVCEQIELSEIPWVTLLGGEPLVYPGLYEVIQRLRSSRVFVKLISNGVLITRRAATALELSGINQVAISLDGLDAVTHELNRGPGSFEKSLRAIRLLQEHVPLVSISLTVTNQVFDQLDRLPEFCAALGISEVYISPLRLTEHTRLPSPDIGPMCPEQQALLPRKVAACNTPELSVISLRECSCGRSSVVIHADGEVSPCPFAVRRYGNLFIEPFLDIWQRITPVAKRIGRLVPGAYCFRRHELAAHRDLERELVAS